MMMNKKDKQKSILTAVALQDELNRSLKLTSPSVSCFLKSAKSENHNAEYILRSNYQTKTLAQKLGLVQYKEPLNEEEWKVLKVKAEDRRDYEQPCVICKIDLGAQQHVIISCSHVFHKSCLQAFEKFTGHKTCPLCRCVGYETRVIQCARVHYLNKCAAKIQSSWKMYKFKKSYEIYRENHPPSHPMLRRKYLENQLGHIVDKLVLSTTMNLDVDEFLHSMNACIIQSKDIHRMHDNCQVAKDKVDWDIVKSKAYERGDEDCPICLVVMKISRVQQTTDTTTTTTNVVNNANNNKNSNNKNADNNNINNKKGSSGNSTKYSRSNSHTTTNNHNNYSTYNNQQLIQSTTTGNTINNNRNTTNKNNNNDNSINNSHNTTTKNTTTTNNNKNTITTTKNNNANKIKSASPLYILSCSHVYHKSCFDTLEKLAQGTYNLSCPVCRSPYYKTNL